jgi:23S rRNA (uridine2552-2'-O)-methyltransferase
MPYNPQDKYFKKAKSENYAARSVYKLEEIQKKFKIIKPSDLVLDLGASPGSWSQYCDKVVGSSGGVFGIDLTLIEIKIPNTTFYQGDIYDLNSQQKIKDYYLERKFSGYDVVISDMAPKTTGIKFADQAKSYDLCLMALKMAELHLKKGGHFVCKFFHSQDFQELRKQLQKMFHKVEALKPDSTRKESKEIFLIGISKR